MKRSVLALTFVLVAAGCGQPGPFESASGSYSPPTPAPSITPPPAFPDELRPDAVMLRGQDVRNPRYDPTRIGKPLDQIDTTFDYDFQELADTELALAGIDRRATLKEIFDEVTVGASNDTERHLAVLDFLQRASVHSGYLQPMYPDGTMVSDPLVLLSLNEMRCGQVAEIAVDLFASAGYPGRLVQLGGHIIAEISYDGGWHYFDADLYGGDQVVRDADGHIPSVAELSHEPERLDAIPAYLENPMSPGRDGSPQIGEAPYPSYFYFSTQAYSGSPNYPGYLTKTATVEEQAASRVYGWDHLHWVAASDIQLRNFSTRWQPGSPVISQIAVAPDGTVTVQWDAAADPDGDVSSYLVYSSSQDRGWHFDAVDQPAVAPIWEGGWSPSMYAFMFHAPVPDIALVATASSSRSFSLGAVQAPTYISIVAMDAYGEAIGRSGGFFTHQLKFEPPLSAP